MHKCEGTSKAASWIACSGGDSPTHFIKTLTIPAILFLE
jgi:hypothetical protein